jgi:hypothetical protein
LCQFELIADTVHLHEHPAGSFKEWKNSSISVEDKIFGRFPPFLGSQPQSQRIEISKFLLKGARDSFKLDSSDLPSESSPQCLYKLNEIENTTLKQYKKGQYFVK